MVSLLCGICVAAITTLAALFVQPLMDDIFIARDHTKLVLFPVGIIVLYRHPRRARLWPCVSIVHPGAAHYPRCAQPAFCPSPVFTFNFARHIYGTLKMVSQAGVAVSTVVAGPPSQTSLPLLPSFPLQSGYRSALVYCCPCGSSCSATSG